MKKVLIAVDDTRGSAAILGVFRNLVRPPEEVVLLHVQRLEGRTLMIDMLGDAERSTLRESLQGTEHKEALDLKAERILTHYRREFQTRGLFRIRTICRDGIPSEEILKVAEEEGVDLILVGCNERRGLSRLISGCVSRELEQKSPVPLIVAKPAAAGGTVPASAHPARLALNEEC